MRGMMVATGANSPVAGQDDRNTSVSAKQTLLTLRYLFSFFGKHLLEQGNQQLPSSLAQVIVVVVDRDAIHITPAAPITAKVGPRIKQRHTTLFSSAVLSRPCHTVTLLILLKTY